MSENKKSEKKENLIVNLAFNIFIPVIILTKYSTEERLGPLNGLLIALAFPLFYGLYDYFKRKKKNFVSILGFISVLITGIIGVFQFPPEWVAVKEALIPFVIGLAVLISIWTPFPLVRKLIYNEEVLDIQRIESILQETGRKSIFDKTLNRASIFLSGSFFLSSALNYILAKIIVKSPAGTTAFNEEIGRMTMLSYPVIAVPSLIITLLILWYMIRSVKKITGLESDEIYSEKLRSAAS